MSYKQTGSRACTEGCCIVTRDSELRPWRYDADGNRAYSPTVVTPRPIYSIHEDVGGDGYTHEPRDHDHLASKLNGEKPTYL